MRKYYYSTNKVIGYYGLYFAMAVLGLVAFCFLYNGFRNFVSYVPFILYGIYIAACILRRVYFKEAVVTILPERLIVDKINAVFMRKTTEIAFDEIYYITTDIKKGSKSLYLKTKDDSEYKFNFNMLDSTHEEIVIELKKYHKDLLDGGVFEYNDDNSLNLD